MVVRHPDKVKTEVRFLLAQLQKLAMTVWYDL